VTHPRPLLLAAVLLAACGAGEPIGSGKTTYTYGGVFAGEDGTEAGNFSVSVVVEDSSGTGTFVVNGAAHPFSAITIDGTEITALGSGYTFAGTITESAVAGSYLSPTGGGLFTGLRRFSGTTVTSYCGTHIGTRDGVPIAGPFAFAERGSIRRGVFTSVLSDPFRGYLQGATGTSPVQLDTLSGDALVATTGPGGFSGSYAMAAGDTGQTAGQVCRSSVTSPILSVLEGVLGSFDGQELGDFAFSLSSTGLGSTGSFKVGGVARNFLAVISGVSNRVAAFDSSFRFLGTIDTTTMSGSYAEGGALAGRAGGILTGGQSVDKYCGALTYGAGGTGAFAFLVRADSAIFGLYTGGTGSAFQGDVSGVWGVDSVTSMEGQTGLVVILPSPGSFGGYFDLSGTDLDGTMTGGSCP
jgi:FlaG/FlaF family flagellin (archaellin)